MALLNLDETYLRRSPSLEVMACSNLRIAFDTVRDSDIDCAVSDYDISAMARVELLKIVREDHGSPPLILSTGKGNEEVTSDIISAGVTDCLQKQPFSEQYELPVNRIESSTSEHRAARRAECYETVLEALSYPVYIVDKRGRFECVSDVFVDCGGSKVAVTVGRTHDGFYVEDGGDGFPDDHSPEECLEADGSEYRGGGLTHRRRLNF